MNEQTKIKKAMISQPMNGKSDEEINETRERAIKELQSRGYQVVNTLFTDEWYNTENMEKRGVVQIPLCFLAKSLENMSLCDVVYFCKEWENARGCKIEHEVCLKYGIPTIYECDALPKENESRTMEIKEAEKLIDDMYQDKMNTRVEITANNTVIHVNKKVTFTELEVASVILLREELSLKRKLEEKNKIIELMADFYAKGNTIRGTKEQIIEEFEEKAGEM